MASTYGKLTLASFREALKSGRYKTATDARRSVGKASEFSDRDKGAARTEIDRHFGVEAQAARPTRPTPRPKPRAAVAPKTAKARVKSKAVPAEAVKQYASEEKRASFPRRAPEDLSSVEAQMKIATDTIQQVSHATQLVMTANDKGYMADGSQPFYTMVNKTLSSAVQVFDQIVKRVAPAPTAPPAKAAPSAKVPVGPADAGIDIDADKDSARTLLRNSRPDAASA